MSREGVLTSPSTDYIPWSVLNIGHVINRTKSRICQLSEAIHYLRYIPPNLSLKKQGLIAKMVRIPYGLHYLKACAKNHTGCTCCFNLYAGWKGCPFEAVSGDATVQN